MDSKTLTALGVGAGTLALLGGTALVVSKSRKKKAKSKSKTRKTKSTSRKRKQRQPYTAGKGKDRSTRRIRFTKNNQPYIILKSGKARFIKKSSARLSRKRKGGRY